MSFWTLLLALAVHPVDDTMVVKNQKTPSGKAQTLVFEEDLRFGADEASDDYLWAATSVTLTVDDAGHIFVGDPKTNDIREFDAEGKFLRKIASEGPGPGELQALNRIQFLADGRLAVFEQKPMFPARIQYYDKDGKFLKLAQPQGMGTIPLTAVFNPTGTMYVGPVMHIDVQGGALVTKTGISKTENFSLEKEYSSFSRKVDFSRMGDPAVMADMIGDIIDGFFAGAGVFAFDKDGNLYAAMSGSYEITKWDPTLSKKLLVISREYKPIALTDEEKRAVADSVADNFRQTPMASMVTDEFIDRMMGRINFPTVKDPIEGMGVTEDGHLLVVHDFNVSAGKQTVDIFSPEGKYLGQTTRENWAFMDPDRNWRMVFKKGYAYTIETDDADDNRLVRYRYRIAAP